MSNVKQFLTITETAEMTGLSTFFIRQGVRDGWIPHIMCGNRVMINLRLFLPMLDIISKKGAQET